MAEYYPSRFFLKTGKLQISFWFCTMSSHYLGAHRTVLEKKIEKSQRELVKGYYVASQPVENRL
jgi:hypothetical protein